MRIFPCYGIFSGGALHNNERTGADFAALGGSQRTWKGVSRYRYVTNELSLPQVFGVVPFFLPIMGPINVFGTNHPT